MFKNIKTLPHKSKTHLVTADFFKVISREMRIYYPPVSVEPSREPQEKMKVMMT